MLLFFLQHVCGIKVCLWYSHVCVCVHVEVGGWHWVSFSFFLHSLSQGLSLNSRACWRGCLDSYFAPSIPFLHLPCVATTGGPSCPVDTYVLGTWSLLLMFVCTHFIQWTIFSLYVNVYAYLCSQVQMPVHTCKPEEHVKGPSLLLSDLLPWETFSLSLELGWHPAIPVSLLTPSSTALEWQMCIAMPGFLMWVIFEPRSSGLLSKHF